jgi:protein involved in polysaccharide export with SLBB domain
MPVVQGGWSMRPEMGRGFGAWVVPALEVLGICFLVSGCGGTSAEPATPADVDALKTAATNSPVLAPGEKINVIVYGEASLTGDYLIDPSGYVSLPLAGSVKAAGLTPDLLQRNLEKQFSSKYLTNPKVTVEVVEFRPFYILGEVEKPGAYPYTGGLTVLSAIAIAGGTTYRAKTSEALIQHLGEDHMREYELNGPIPLLPGDIIQIPRRYF